MVWTYRFNPPSPTMPRIKNLDKFLAILDPEVAKEVAQMGHLIEAQSDMLNRASDAAAKANERIAELEQQVLQALTRSEN